MACFIDLAVLCEQQEMAILAHVYEEIDNEDVISPFYSDGLNQNHQCKCDLIYSHLYAVQELTI